MKDDTQPLALLTEKLDRRPRLLGIQTLVMGDPQRKEIYIHDRWSLILFDYCAEVTIAGHEYDIRPGYAAVIPPRMRRFFRFSGKSLHRVVNWRWEDDERAEQLKHPVFLDTGDRWEAMRATFDEALSLYPIRPRHAEVKLWDLLFSLLPSARFKGRRREHDHPALTAAVQMIEQDLTGYLSIGDLAKRVGVSQNYLIILFKKKFGLPVNRYIRSRRLQLARRLLEYTDMSVKAIAIRVGIPDPHHFNKCIRRQFALSPTALREASLGHLG
jgi:AraC-like DNA-binding protein